jgi:chromate transport protein ChrA
MGSGLHAADMTGRGAMPISAIPLPEQSVNAGVFSRAVTLRAALLLGCAASVALAACVARPAPHLESDPELGRLLRGMALIKAGIVLAAISVLWRRFKRPVPAALAAAYLIATWLAAGASMLIWQLTAIPFAAIIFHAGGLAFLIAAWREYQTSTEVRAAWSFFECRR